MIWSIELVLNTGFVMDRNGFYIRPVRIVGWGVWDSDKGGFCEWEMVS